MGSQNDGGVGNNQRFLTNISLYQVDYIMS